VIISFEFMAIGDDYDYAFNVLKQESIIFRDLSYEIDTNFNYS